MKHLEHLEHPDFIPSAFNSGDGWAVAKCQFPLTFRSNATFLHKTWSQFAAIWHWPLLIGPDRIDPCLSILLKTLIGHYCLWHLFTEKNGNILFLAFNSIWIHSLCKCLNLKQTTLAFALFVYLFILTWNLFRLQIGIKADERTLFKFFN